MKASGVVENCAPEEKVEECVLSPKVLDEAAAPESQEPDSAQRGAEVTEAAKERASQRQLLAMKELCQSERNYLQMLQLSTVTIRGNLHKLQPPPDDLDSMFLYIEDVMDVSRRLLSLLDQKQPEDPSFLETVCNSFLSLSSDIEGAYKEYMANYNNVTALENDYRQNEGLWNNMKKVIKTSAPEVNAPSLSFFLVMPVQRMARYPLLLQNIQTHTEITDPAYDLLEHTAHIAVSLNCRINEYKRFREVADRYKKTEILSIKEKINRLNSHSIVKKTSRLSQQFKHETGLAPKEMRMQKLIYKPLCALRGLLVGPRNLIRKRLDKLLDFELIESKPSLCYEEQSVANTYRTINKLLLSELPQFNGLALQMIWSLLGTISCLHRDLASDMEQLFHSFAQQLPHSSLSSSAFWDWAGSEVLQGAQRLEVLCQCLENSLNAPVFQPLSPFSQRRLKLLTNKHGSGKIYQVSGSVVGSRDLDLSLTRGELVAVISKADVRGDKCRWLVDTGGKRGYAPSSKLVHYHQPIDEPQPSLDQLVPESQPEIRRHSYTPERQLRSVSTVPCFQVFAAYDFTAQGSHQVSVRSGEPVRVLEPYDKKGNSEWSLVEVRGCHRGYVPSNYLARMPVGTGLVSTLLPRR